MNALLLALISLLPAVPADDPPCVIIVVGAAGTDEYAQPFADWAGRWQSAAEQSGATFIGIGRPSESSAAETSATGEKPAAADSDRERLRLALESQASTSSAPLWLVLIGHGTFDGQTAKFNLVGPDITPADLSGWLESVSRPVAVIDCASASSPFLAALSGENRMIVTATRSGNELNYARFGDYMSQAISDPAADLDKDEQVSLLEAYITASKRTEEFYKTDSRLATEHALLDDNGDGLGTPAEWFHGVRATRRAKDGAALDGVRAHQLILIKSPRELALPEEFRAKRDELELAIAALRDQKDSLANDEYYNRLEVLLLDLARLYQTLPEDLGK